MNRRERVNEDQIIRVRIIGQELKRQALILGSIVAIFWLIEVADWLIFHGSLDTLGVQPRRLIGLRGILFGPFMHADFRHLLANTFPFLILGWFVLLRSLRDFIIVSMVAVVVSGLGVWLIGPSRSVHIGASGLVFGYFGFLLLRGYFERSLSSILWAILVVILYGGMVFGLLPGGRGISWQAHLFGFAGGGVAAYWVGNNRRTSENRD
jgi:membrane associated rhomboid family serine protease